MAQALEQLSQRCDKLDENLSLLARSHATIWANQKELTKSETLLDEQFAVLSRLTIISINLMAVRHNLAIEMLCSAIGKEDTDDLSFPDIDYDDVNLLFEQWAKFRERPDFRQHMRAWFMGDDLSKLPPPPEPPAEEEDQVKEETQEPGEEDVSDSGNEEHPSADTSSGGERQEDEMPRVSG